MRLIHLLSLSSAVYCSAAIQAAPPLVEAEVAKLHAAIRPAAGEDPFDSIPWQTNLWSARGQAAAAGKPILLWEMDGHPLGCG
jgi:hypothetical protein